MSDPRIPDMSKRESLLVHIEGLQATITKRNRRIEELEAQLSLGSESPAIKRAIDEAYKSGWQEACGHLMESMRPAAVALGKVRADARELYHAAASRKNIKDQEDD